jgi:hypothetical protein
MPAAQAVKRAEESSKGREPRTRMGYRGHAGELTSSLNKDRHGTDAIPPSVAGNLPSVADASAMLRAQLRIARIEMAGFDCHGSKLFLLANQDFPPDIHSGTQSTAASIPVDTWELAAFSVS